MSGQVPQLTSDEWYVYLSINRQVSVAELSAMTGFSEGEVKQHLTTLEDQGLIAREAHQGAVGYQRTVASAPESPEPVAATPPKREAAQQRPPATAARPSAPTPPKRKEAQQRPPATGSAARSPAPTPPKRAEAQQRPPVTGGAARPLAPTPPKRDEAQQRAAALAATPPERQEAQQRPPPTGAAARPPAPTAPKRDEAQEPPPATGAAAHSAFLDRWFDPRGPQSEDRSPPDRVAASIAAPPKTAVEHGPTPARRRRVSKADIALLLVTVLAIVSALVLATSGNLQVGNMAPTGGNDDPGNSSPRSTSEGPTDPPEDSGIGAAPAEGDLQLQVTSYSGEPFEAVPIQGTYVGADAGIALRVQRMQDGEWVDFPLPAVTGEGGSFSTNVQLGAGRYRLRVADPESDVVSDEIVLRIG